MAMLHYWPKKEHFFTLDQIGNMDETFVTFDFQTNQMVNQKGEKNCFDKNDWTWKIQIHYDIILLSRRK